MNRMNRFLIKRKKDIEKLDLAKKLGVAEQACVASYDEERKVLSVCFDKHTIQVPQVLNAVMEVTEVSDIRIQETQLSEIVKAIYKRDLKQDMA